jgi:hypothetical protein
MPPTPPLADPPVSELGASPPRPPELGEFDLPPHAAATIEIIHATRTHDIEVTLAQLATRYAVPDSYLDCSVSSTIADLETGFTGRVRPSASAEECGLRNRHSA